MEKNLKSDSLSIPLLKSQLPLLNLITPFSLPTLFWNTLMSLLCLITKPSMISAED